MDFKAVQTDAISTVNQVGLHSISLQALENVYRAKYQLSSPSIIEHYRKRFISRFTDPSFLSVLKHHELFNHLMGLTDPDDNLAIYRQTIDLYLKKASIYEAIIPFSNIGIIEFILLELGARNNLRVIISERIMPWVIQFCEANGLFFLLFPAKIQQRPHCAKSFFSNRAKGLESIWHSGTGKLIAYIARQPDQALQLLVSELNEDHSTLGQLLDYPECCIEFFCSNLARANRQYDGEFVPFSLENSPSMISFPFQTNNLMRYWHIALLFHFPCSYLCKQSIAIANHYYRALVQHYPGVAHSIASTLSRPILYTENEGVFHLSECDIGNGNDLFYSAAHVHGTTWTSALALAIRKSNRICMDGKVLKVYRHQELLAERRQTAWLIYFS
jgi:hypothetical protein